MSTYNKYRLLADIKTVIYHAEPIIKARIDIGSFENFSTAYSQVYHQLHEDYEVLTTNNQLLKEKIDDLKVFKPVKTHFSIWSIYGIIGYIFSKFKEAKKVREIREIYNTISLVKMLIENED